MLRGFLLASAIGILGGSALQSVSAAEDPVPYTKESVARGEYVTTPEQYKAALQRAYEAAVKEKVATLINVQSSRQFLTNAFPPGAQPRNVEPGVTAYAPLGSVGDGLQAVPVLM